MSVEVELPAFPVVQTKLFPPVRRELVSRAPLVERLCEPRPLALIRAPAGWGKSTLLADWNKADQRRFAWLALDPADNDPIRFWIYFIEALRTTQPEFGSLTLPVVCAPGVDLAEDVLPVLVNELLELAQPTVLVLDDYHLLEAGEIHDALGRLFEHPVPALELAIATRAEPPLPLPRLRARGDLVEIDSAGLGFSAEDAEHLLNGLYGLRLEPSDVAALRERTEGWAAGLYLAALSLRDRGDPSAFIASFAGGDRHIVDYLGEEVLALQPGDVRQFLLESSILERFSASALAAVTGVDRAAAMLADVERSNLFLIPLDTRRGWYRYHHLFGDLLRQELHRAHPELVPELHRRAARWLLEQGLVSDAIGHTIASGDLALASELVAQHWAVTLLGTAGDRTIESWLSRLPAEVIEGDLRLCIARCYVAQSLGRPEETEKWLRVAETAPLPGPFQDGFTSADGARACVRAGHLWLTGDTGGAMDAADDVLALETGPWRAIGVAVLGLGRAGRGEWDKSRSWMAEYSRIGAETGQHLNDVSGRSTVSACDAELGDWPRALEGAEAAIELARAHGIDEHWCCAHAHLGRGLALERQGSVEDAAVELDRSVALARRGAGPVSIAWALLHLARVEAARGDPAGARACLEEAHSAVASAPDPGIMPERLAAAGRQLGGSSHVALAGEPLSERELAVLRLLGTRLSQREIGNELFISLNTVKSHTRTIFRKLGVSSRAEAVERARELGLG